MMAVKPLHVSVVMATYNGKPYLAEQLQSVLGQLLPGDELIIVDDGSRDGTPELAEALQSAFVQVVRNPRNLGVLASFERGLSMASREIIFLCDQDDVWLCGKRAIIVAAFENDPRVLVVVSDAELINAVGLVTAPSFMQLRGGFHGGFWSTVVKNRYLGCAMALRRELLAVALPIPPTVPMHDMWFGALASVVGRVYYIPKPLMQYRRHGSNVSPARSQGWLRIVRWRIRLLNLLTRRLLTHVTGFHVHSMASSAGKK
jgi:glycosyltransferase involved in cell wall biosynthesis